MQAISNWMLLETLGSNLDERFGMTVKIWESFTVSVFLGLTGLRAVVWSISHSQKSWDS